jgi:uncharacterized integral membrane protein
MHPPHLGRVMQAHPVRSEHVGVDRSQRLRVIVASVLGALVTLFAVLNFDEVDVNWILGTWSTPLIVVIVLCLVAGMAIDRMLVRRARSPVKHPERGSGRHAS